MKNKSFGEIIGGGIDTVKDVLKNTAAEIYICAGLCGLIGGGIGLNYTLKNSRYIPLAFSEIGQIERNAEKEGIKVGPVTAYELRVNDLCMKIFEAENDANEFSFSTNQRFYSNIYDALTLRNIYKYNLKNLLDSTPSYIPKVREKLNNYYVVGKDLTSVNKNMDAAWDEDHDDVYRPEVRTRTYTDSNGNTQTETYIEMVYDYTIHTYDYDKRAGEAGHKNLEEMFRKNSSLSINEKILKTNKTNADGEYVAEKSRKKKSDEKFNEEDFVNIANTWFSGSTILNNCDFINKNYDVLKNQASNWAVAKNSSKSERYKTYSHSDSGPKEFQIAENVLENGKSIKYAIDEVFYSLDNTDKNISKLRSTLEKLTEEGYIKNKKSGKKLRKEVMNITKEIYKDNFKKGVDVDFNGLAILLGLVLGGFAGGLIGAGIDHLTDKNDFYDKIKYKK